MDDECQLLNDQNPTIDDPLVAEVDIYLTRLFADQLYLFQYPLRPKHLDLDNASNIVGARLKAKNKLVQLDFEIDRQSNFHCEDRERIVVGNWSKTSNDDPDSSPIVDHLTFSSNNVTLGENHKRFAVGMLTSNRLQLSPLNAIFQMRPDLDLTSTSVNQNRTQTSTAVSEDEDENIFNTTNPSTKPNHSIGDDSATEDEQSYKLVTMKFWRPEGRLERERKLRSYNYFERAKQEERWIDLAYFSANEQESIDLRRKWAIHDQSALQRLPVRWRKLISIDDYFHLLLTFPGQEQVSLTTKQCLMAPGTDNLTEQKPLLTPTTKPKKTTKIKTEKTRKESTKKNRTTTVLTPNVGSDEKQIPSSSSTPLSSISVPSMIIKPDPETIQHELLSFMKRRFGYRPYFKLSEINIAIKLELISSPPGHPLATGISEASILRAAAEIGAIHVNKKWPKNLKQEAVFINTQMGDKYDTLRRYVADLLERCDGFQFGDLRLRIKQENQNQLFPIGEVKKFVKDHCITKSSRKGVVYCVKGTLVK